MGTQPPAVLSALQAASLFTEVFAGHTEILGVLEDAPILVMDLDDDGAAAGIPPVPWVPCVTVGVCGRLPRQPPPAAVDVAITASGGPPPSDRPAVPSGWVVVDDVDRSLDVLSTQVANSAEAAIALCQVLRLGITHHGDVSRALFDESLAYSTLQSGPGFAAWLASPGERAFPCLRDGEEVGEEEAQTVTVDRQGDVMSLTLNRPQVRNALDARMRDGLAAALAVAVADPSIRSVHLRGAGSAFCAGGDLSEFGTAPDPMAAHLVRTTRSPARLLARIATRTTAHLHGACIGAGIELAAFCHRVIAAPDTFIQLPEVGFGLIPGAGGTASLPLRIGRHRACWLGLTGVGLDTPTAVEWGLVDAVTA